MSILSANNPHRFTYGATTRQPRRQFETRLPCSISPVPPALGSAADRMCLATRVGATPRRAAPATRQRFQEDAAKADIYVAVGHDPPQRKLGEGESEVVNNV